MKKNKQILDLLILIFLLLSKFSFSQSFAPTVISVPSSPEAALLGRFGDIPVGYYTGTSNISIPLYSIKENGIEIPISLSYHGSGIKVADEATWVGLGWSLEPEGSIIQEIRGKEDSFDNTSNYLGGYQDEYNSFRARLFGTPESNEYFYGKTFQLGVAHWKPCYLVGALPPGYPYDSHSIMGSLMQGNGEPDIYNYNFSGYSGKFFINPDTRQIVLIDKKEEIIFENLGSSFKAITPDGNIFIFNIIEKSYGQNPAGSADFAGQTYKLSSIQLTNNKTINFTYSNTLLVTQNSVQASVRLNYICNTLPYPDLNPPVMQGYFSSEVKTLNKITSNDVIINFNLEDREDLIQTTYNTETNPKRLKSIDIISPQTNKKIKTFQFGYSYFLSQSSLSNLGKRLKLDSVKEVGYDKNEISDNSKPAHIFQYDLSVTLPNKNSLSVDFWGYFNGQDNIGLLPNIDYFNPYNLSILKYTKSNRYADNTKAKAYLLNKITYPTGGFTEFYYEPNSFTNQFIPDKVALSKSQKYVSIQDNNNDESTLPKTFEPAFELSKTVTIHFNNSIMDGTAFPGSTSYSLYELEGTFIEFKKIKNGITSVIKRWDLTSVYNVDFERDHKKVWIEDIVVPYDSGAKYTITTYLPGNKFTKPNDTYRIATAKSIIQYDDDTGVDTSVSYGGGFRISNIKNYTKNGVVVSNKKINYINENGTSSGKLLNQFKPLQDMQMFCNYCGASNNGLPTSKSVAFTQYTLSTTDFGMNGGNSIGYSRVEEIELAENNLDTNGKKIFTYYNNTNLTKPGFPNIVYGRNGQLNSETVLDKSGDPILYKSYNYKNLQNTTNTFEGVKIFYHSIGAGDWGDPFYVSGDDGSYVYTYETYPINSYWFATESILTTNFLTKGKVSSIENYIYNSKGKIRSTITKNSNNEILQTDNFYSSDNEMNGKPLALELRNKNMISNPLETITFKAGIKLTDRVNNYDKSTTTSNLLLLNNVYAAKFPNSLANIPNIGNLEKKIAYDKYDDKGNILQYTMENGTSVSIIWGYNKTLPIAKIENATNAQIATALGVSDVSVLNETNLAAINALRSNVSFANCMITTYAHIPLVGVSTITDSKGDTITYTYDSFGRLQFVKDKNNNILSENQYNYKH
jgi:hypothetical protein